MPVSEAKAASVDSTRRTSRISPISSAICSALPMRSAAAAKSATTCKQCNGRGQVRYQQGFFSISRGCPICHGARVVITDPCSKCRGEQTVQAETTLDVKVPAGVEEGTRILYNGHGDAGVHGGPNGDVYVVLHVKEHPFFER